MSKKEPLVIRLLLASHGKQSCGFINELTSDQMDYFIAIGLGPVAYSAQSQAGGARSEDLTSANLTARVIHGEMRRATTDLLTLAQAAGLDPVLLKGISVADEFYNPSHQRIMGDVDVLVPDNNASRLSDLLKSSGYTLKTVDGIVKTPANHHHLPALLHPQSGVPIEIHRALISTTAFAREPLLQPAAFVSEIQRSSFADLPCRRFSIEYQIAYTLVHWAIDQKWPANVISINDFIHLMNSTQRTIVWQKIASWMEQSYLFADVFTVLARYLEEFGLVTIPRELLARVRDSDKRLGAVNRWILRWLLVTFPLSGNRKVGRLQERIDEYVTTVWLALLEPRHKALRPFIAFVRVARSIAGSIANRVRSLFQQPD